MRSRVTGKTTRRLAALSCLGLAAATLAYFAPSSQADTAENMCETAEWDGATAGGEDLAYKVPAPPPPNGTTVSCFVESTTVSAREGEPLFLRAGYQLASKPTPDHKNLAFLQILCFDAADEEVFKISVSTNMYDGVSETGFYPRALFDPPATGDYDCGVRMANYKIGQPARPVYAISGYLDVVDGIAASDKDGSTGSEPQDFPDGKSSLHLPRGSKTELRRAEVTMPEGVDDLNASVNVNYTKCSPGDDHSADKCPSQYGTESSLHKLRIVAWQTKVDSDEVCRYLAPPDSAVEWKEVTGDRHHRGLKADAEMTLTDDPACSRDIVVTSVIEISSSSNHVSGFAAGQNTVLSAYG
ncbi:MAG: hypothetical protein ACRDXX_20840 [Stackebrandtia sp.]